MSIAWRPMYKLLTLFCVLLPAVAMAANPPATRPATTRPASLKDAHRIVFLVDTRPTLWPLFHAMRDELWAAVTNLRPDQFFTVIVMRPQTPSLFNLNPIRADDTTKKAAGEFINAIDGNRTIDAVAGIRKAVELQPDLLCFIVGDDFPPSDAVKRAFQPLHGRLNVFLFTGYMPRPNEFLRTLAVEHSGRAIDQNGVEIKPPKPPEVHAERRPESRPSVLER